MTSAPRRPLRWRFPHPGEEQARQAIIDRIDAWWRAFAARADSLAPLIAGGSKETLSLAQELQAHLVAIDEGLAWEVGPEHSGNGKHVLAITAENRMPLQPLVEAIL